MTTITKERIELFIKNPLENGLTRGEQMELARIVLASLDAEPVAWECGENIILFNPDTVEAYAKRAEISPKPLFAAPPVPVVPVVPVVPDEWTIQDAVNFCRETGRQDAGSDMEAWNACRTAMLQGGQPVSNHDELALYYLQGQKDGLEWAAQLAEANHPLTGDWLYDDPLELAKAIRKGPDMPGFAGSSQVSPGGWISCSERMPEQGAYISAVSKHGEYVSGQVIDDWLDLHDGTSFGLDEVYLWMMLPPLPASPQQ